MPPSNHPEALQSAFVIGRQHVAELIDEDIEVLLRGIAGVRVGIAYNPDLALGGVLLQGISVSDILSDR